MGTCIVSVSVNNESLNPPSKLIRLREPYPSDALLIVEWRKGYGEEALRLLLRFAFGELGLFKVYGDILSNNHAAIRLDRKIGFFKEALFPKHVLKDGKRHNVVRMAIFQ